MVQDDFDNSDFDTMVQNAIIYGTGVLVMDLKNGDLITRVVPIEEYTELGENLKWIDQNKRKHDDS
jgi:hypothetical protein